MFHFAAFRWCITRAAELIAADPSAADFTPAAGIVGLEQFLPLTPDPPDTIRLIRVLVDTEYAMTTDLSRPVLVASLEHHGDQLGAVVIDGWHRVYRALREGRTHLPALVLRADTERAARIPYP
ncbi:hypothetical protein [Alloactinosynnema sp. L-07]|nr:hypothetical protein [Alloactinosynnema sp. L-07]